MKLMKINDKIIFKMLYTMAPFYQREEKYLQFRSILRRKRIPEDEIEVFFFQLSSLFADLVQANTLSHRIWDKYQIVYSPQFALVLETDMTPIQYFRSIIQEHLFGEYSKEMAVIFYNAYRLRLQKLPLIIGNRLLEQLEYEINRGLADTSIEEILFLCEAKSLFFNQVYASLSREELITILKSNQKVIQTEFSIQNMWLYGSFAREEQTEYSDIDIMVDTLANCDLQELKKYLTTMCRRPVDIKIFQSESLFFSKDAIQERICIFSHKR